MRIWKIPLFAISFEFFSSQESKAHVVYILIHWVEMKPTWLGGFHITLHLKPTEVARQNKMSTRRRQRARDTLLHSPSSMAKQPCPSQNPRILNPNQSTSSISTWTSTTSWRRSLFATLLLNHRLLLLPQSVAPSKGFLSLGLLIRIKLNWSMALLSWVFFS